MIHFVRVANSVDPDEMPRCAAFHQGLHCFKGFLIHKWLTKYYRMFPQNSAFLDIHYISVE